MLNLLLNQIPLKLRNTHQFFHNRTTVDVHRIRYRHYPQLPFHTCTEQKDTVAWDFSSSLKILQRGGKLKCSKGWAWCYRYTMKITLFFLYFSSLMSLFLFFLKDIKDWKAGLLVFGFIILGCVFFILAFLTQWLDASTISFLFSFLILSSHQTLNVI